MLLGPDDVGDLKIVVVHNVGQVVEAGPVCPLDDVVLFLGPLELDPATDQVVDHKFAFARHFEPDHCASTLGLKPPGILRPFGHPAAAVHEGPLLALSLLPLGLDLVGRRVVPIGGAPVDELPDGIPVTLEPLGLIVRCMRSPHLRPLVPVDSQPTESVKNRFQRLLHIAVLVGIVDAKNELAAVPAGKKPAK
jgi:hypothetical protein